jgi:hypothetical protein
MRPHQGFRPDLMLPTLGFWPGPNAPRLGLAWRLIIEEHTHLDGDKGDEEADDNLPRRACRCNGTTGGIDDTHESPG